ncbi:uncharacterized protein LACBIDRAFT_310049 [Laccaria bicolor S238N-H82]|uniref:Predicted protein n=1 Tax=Laccaria bicolor (strain S238N-H82 / ATCC MYA-4686) TaxID=486041 RepID=B0DTJ7_LACBS|nr:uncharacterized protein LACBIDRAFT_310055 [Laccaria bicolor S238N-H82]XP_001887285.1 uncharacterized protein LACBIDRAFT_310049 [Laccaria bicolor S238N-H82]EDR02074.1 predicted protein [Laccaria bicolor S238N-H82]EDR02128.1 predicted protein [Laccaria bicolor S238N-H82]|eukprot:XP_001887231.1 predicted protein [Laccaria bicolor S238N-H82]
MGLTANTSMEIKIDKVFISLSMNSHTEDLRSTAKSVLAARPDAGVVAIIVPGPGLIK